MFNDELIDWLIIIEGLNDVVSVTPTPGKRFDDGEIIVFPVDINVAIDEAKTVDELQGIRKRNLTQMKMIIIGERNCPPPITLARNLGTMSGGYF